MRPPSPEALEAAVRRVMDALVTWGAKKVILYGSVARGDYTASSDIDLIVVKETTERSPQRIAEALGLCFDTRPPLPVEPLVYTPEEFAGMVRDENPLLTEALRHGRVLHDQA